MNETRFIGASRWLARGCTILLWLFFIACKKQPALHDSETIRQLLSHQNVGLAYLEENQLQEAKREYQIITKLAPEEALGYANLAVGELRSGHYSEAERQAKKALSKSSAPDIHLILAEIYDRQGNTDQAIEELEASLQKNPRHVRSHFKAAQLYLRKGRWAEVELHLAEIVEVQPGNIAARLQYIEALIRNRKGEQAVTQLEEIRRQIPELPNGAADYFQKALDALRASNPAAALMPVIAIHNILKPTPIYQNSIIELLGPGGAMIGFPIVHFSQQILTQLKNEKTRLATIRFLDRLIDVPSSSLRTQKGAGKTPALQPTEVVAADYNNDGRIDLFISGASRLLLNIGSNFVDATSQAGLQKLEESASAAFGDFDNDGKIDLYVVQESHHSLYKNIGNGRFTDVTQKAGIEEIGPGRAIFVDLDNEGDLDLLLLKPDGNRAYRNNGDGTFTEFSQQLGIAGSAGEGAVFGDFDEDGDVDLLISGKQQSVLYTNLRQGHFQQILKTGLPSPRPGPVIASADYNNDGFLDLFLGSHLYVNNQNGTFRQIKFPSLADVSDASFLDFDNDGLQDLALISENRIHLYRNEGSGKLTEVSSLIPPFASRSFKVADWDSDGDEDLVVITTDSKAHLVRNDGGNANYWVNVRPVGLGPESGKNNRNSIGAKVEVKSGALYQMAVVTQPVVHFGLGDKNRADVVRVIWTNGVAQNHVLPQSNQTIVEKQVLKGSCAFLYAWNGTKYDFVTDILWKSALGMPLGIMSGEMRYGFPDSTREYLKIPFDALKEQNNSYSVRITEELWEAAYLDKSNLILVDHPNTVELYVDERFVTPPYPPLHIYPVAEKILPLGATDEHGKNLLPLLEKNDNRYVADFAPGKYQGIAEIHDLILDLGRFGPDSDVVLFLNGWLLPTDASINVAVAQSDVDKIVWPYLQVPDAHGNWQTVIPNLGFPQGKNKTMVIDMKGKFFNDDYRVRIRTNMEIFWDSVFFTKNEPDCPVKMTELKAVSADLHYRGFSRVYRKGVDGPFWFDYSQVSTEEKWRDLVGNYTRYGDVAPLLQESDDQYVLINSGDEISIRYDASNAPPLRTGWTRDYLLYSDGWMKDGDLSTAQGKTVDPYPFHAMKAYPYDPKLFPQDALHQEFLRKYNTRKVTADRFRKLQ